MAATTTDLGRRIEPVNEMKQLAFAGSGVLQNISELAEGNITNLAAPQFMHGLEIERFQDKDTVLLDLAKAGARPTGTRLLFDFAFLDLKKS